MNFKPQKKVLIGLKNLIEKLDSKSFSQKNKTLFGASIGEHFRHIIEFYMCCFEQTGESRVNYDLRKRDKQLELDIRKGIQTLDQILMKLDRLNGKRNHMLIMDNSLDSKSTIQTSLFRELTYCMDHCIHHQSLIKIALLEQGLVHLVDQNFGVAFSTQNYRNQCAS
ncbi:MAG: DinB family protein [Flavobacteriaceae bacterium]